MATVIACVAGVKGEGAGEEKGKGTPARKTV